MRQEFNQPRNRIAQPRGGHLLPSHKRKVEEACQYIQEHSHEHLTSEQVAHAIGRSRTWLYQHFKARTNRSLRAYIQMVRVDHAIDLLLSSDLMVKQIARRAGFQSERTFYRALKRDVGLSPQALRDMLNREQEFASQGSYSL